MDHHSPSPGPPDERSPLSAVAPVQQQKQLSRLEALPAELLERIFFHSLELNFPRASIYIGRVLSKPIIYKWLIRLAFSSPNLSSRYDFFTSDFLPPPLDFWAISVGERIQLQASILECRWSTLQLFRECQRDYVKHVIRQKCKDLIFSAEDQAILDNIDHWLEHPIDFDLATHGRRGSGDLILKAKKCVVDNTINASSLTPSSSTTSMTTSGDEMRSTLASLSLSLSSGEAATTSTSTSATSDVRIAIWIHFGAIQIREPSPISYEIDVFRLPCPPSVDERPRMPDKLLHKPWTPDKLELLLLLSQETYIDEDNVSNERSRNVLRQLIRDRDYATFEKLLAMNVIAKNYNYPQKWPVKMRHFRAALRYAEGSNDPFIRLLYQERWHSLGERERDIKDAILKNMHISSPRMNY